MLHLCHERQDKEGCMVSLSFVELPVGVEIAVVTQGSQAQDASAPFRYHRPTGDVHAVLDDEAGWGDRARSIRAAAAIIHKGSIAIR